MSETFLRGAIGKAKQNAKKKAKSYQQADMATKKQKAKK